MLYYIIVQNEVNFKGVSRKMDAKNKISGIICEFNPLHNGHEALIRHVREHTGSSVVCIMSGNFVQRGEAAALDKWSRTALALKAGADLVIELPLPWAMSGAERFALGGVSLLNALGCADTLAFGSECGNADALLRIARYLLSESFTSDVRPFLSEGLPFAAARSKAIETALGTHAAELNEQPNNILGIEYCKALITTDSAVSPYTIRRFEVGHDDETVSDRYASASLLRRLSASGESVSQFVPDYTDNCIEALKDKKQYPADINRLDRAVLGFLSTCPANALRRTPDVSEGLENKIRSAAGTVSTLAELYDAVKSKRYSHARIRRIVLAAYLGLTKDLPDTPPYIRVLGMTEAGTTLLHSAQPTLPFVMRPADIRKLSPQAQHIFELEAKADDLYALCTEARRPAGLDYTEKLIRL